MLASSKTSDWIESIAMFLPRPPAPPPSRQDFDPHGGDLDAREAWKNFGGLGVPEAYEKFLSAPEIHQEDFMFMGARAFAYYFPVIDRYLRTVTFGPRDLGDCEAAILGTAVAAQFEWKGAIISADLRAEIESLRSFVVENFTRYATVEAERRHILHEWQRVGDALAKWSPA